MIQQNPVYRSDPNGETQPVLIPESDPLAHYQPIRVPRSVRPAAHRPRRGGCGCLPLLLALILPLCLISAAFLLTPLPTRLLILGIDRTPDGTALGRSDTIILAQINPLKPDVRLLSIPRDLWVPIPGNGENRINTAHFFAEANQPGSGPKATLQVINESFGVPVRYYVRIRFDGFLNVINAMGGVDLVLSKPMGKYEAGTHHLNGEEALAFARDRKGADDFFRMEHAQVLMVSAGRQMLSPLAWGHIPAVMAALGQSVNTNVPVILWPRLGFALLRATLTGIDTRTITREMVTPWTTDQGAQVLLPNWDAINPLMKEMFGAGK